MIPVRDTAHIAEGLALLIEQFKKRPIIEGVLTSYLSACQTFEDALWAMIDSRDLDNAVDAQLDSLGDLVGELRRGRNNTDYRAAIRLRVRVNRSQGRASDVISVAILATGGNTSYLEYYPAGFEVTAYNYQSPTVLAQMLYSTKAAGTGGVLLTSDWAASSENFTFDYSVVPISGNVWTSVSSVPAELWVAGIPMSGTTYNVNSEFTPLEIPQVALWFDAYRNVNLDTVDPTRVANWTNVVDGVTFYDHLGDGDGPIYNATGLNGKPALVFTNLGDTMVGPTLSGITGEILIVKKNITTGTYGLWSFGADTVGDLHPSTVDNNIYDAFGATARKNAGPPPSAFTTAHVYNVRSGARRWSTFVNGTQAFDTTTNTLAWPGSTTIGSNAASAASHTAISEIVAFNRMLSTQERKRLTDYLVAKWSISVAPVTMSVTAINPPLGHKRGSGVPVTITGSGFTGATSATINSQALTSFVVVNNTTITGVTPTFVADGTYDVSVIKGAETATKFLAYRVAQMAVWLNNNSPSNFVITSGKVQTWHDSGDLGNDVTEAAGNRPVVSGAAVDFVGGKFLSNTVTNLVTANSAYTVVCVGENGNGAVLTLRNTTDYSASTLFSIFGTFYVHGDGVHGPQNVTIADASAETAAAGVAFLSMHRYAGGAVNPEIYINKTLRAITSGATSQATETGTTGFQVAAANSGQPFSGRIAEIFVYPGAVSTNLRGFIDAYVLAKYGI